MTTVTEAIKLLKNSRYRNCRQKSITLSDQIVEKSETIIKKYHQNGIIVTKYEDDVILSTQDWL